MNDKELGARLIRLVQELSEHCPLSTEHQNVKDWERWRRAYNALFTLAQEAGGKIEVEA